jgi:hypothetical protein
MLRVDIVYNLPEILAPSEIVRQTAGANAKHVRLSNNSQECYGTLAVRLAVVVVQFVNSVEAKTIKGRKQEERLELIERQRAAEALPEPEDATEESSIENHCSR